MAVTELNFKYNPETDHLHISVLERLVQVEDSTAVFVFANEEDVPPTSMVFYLGCDEDSDLVTGEIVAVEMLDFYETYLTLRNRLVAKFTQATPPRRIDQDGSVSFNLDEVDFSVIDEDIKHDRDNAVLITNLPRLLDDFYFEVAAYRIQHGASHYHHIVQERQESLERVMQPLA